MKETTETMNPFIAFGIAVLAITALFFLGMKEPLVTKKTSYAAPILTQSETPAPSILSYTRTTTAVETATKNLGVELQYEASPVCDSATTADIFFVEMGDGQSYSADCKGVVRHVYATPGVYAAQYLRNDEAVAFVTIDVTGPATAEKTGE